jgi:hypothetical protein
VIYSGARDLAYAAKLYLNSSGHLLNNQALPPKHQLRFGIPLRNSSWRLFLCLGRYFKVSPWSPNSHHSNHNRLDLRARLEEHRYWYLFQYLNYNIRILRKKRLGYFRLLVTITEYWLLSIRPIQNSVIWNSPTIGEFLVAAFQILS